MINKHAHHESTMIDEPLHDNTSEYDGAQDPVGEEHDKPDEDTLSTRITAPRNRK